MEGERWKGQRAMSGFSSQSPAPCTLHPSPVLGVQRVLVIGPSNIGDAILASEVVAGVRRGFPEAHLTLVVGERAKAFFADDPRIQSLVDVDAFGSPLGRVRLLLALWRYHPHVVVDLRHTLYPMALKPLRVWRYLRRPPHTVPHMRDRHLWALRAQVPSLQTALRDPGGELSTGTRQDGPLWCSKKDLEHVDQLWRRWRLGEGQPLVIICPGARSHIKRWTAEGFARLADRLLGERGARVLFSGEPDEEPIVEAIRGLMVRRAHSAVGLTTIRQLGLLMQRARLVITNDSASLHLASALRVPTVAIFGPTDERKYGPRSAKRRVIRRRLFCAPCEQALCAFSHECMRFITPDEVYHAARQLLVGGRGQGAGGEGGGDE